MLEQAVDVLHLGAGAGGNPALAGTTDNVRLTALARGHGIDNGDIAMHLFLTLRQLGGVWHFSAGGHLVHQTRHAAHFFHLLELIAEIVEIETTALVELLDQLLRLFLIDTALRLLNQRQHVALAKDARRQAIRVERLERVDLLARTQKLDRLAGDKAHRQRRTTARIAIGFGKNHAGQRQRLAEGLGGVHRVLAGHAVHHKQGLDRIERGVQGAYLVHHGRVHVQPSGGIHNQNVRATDARLLKRRARNIHGYLFGAARKKSGANLCGQLLQLIDRCRTINVGTHQQHRFLFAFAQVTRQFGDAGGLARALQASHQHDRRRSYRQIEALVLLAHQDNQRVVHQLDDGLSRRETAQHFLSDGLGAHVLDERLHHRQRHVRFEQRHAHLAQGVTDIGLGETRLAAQAFERRFQPAGQILKHAGCCAPVCV